MFSKAYLEVWRNDIERSLALRTMPAVPGDLQLKELLDSHIEALDVVELATERTLAAEARSEEATETKTESPTVDVFGGLLRGTLTVPEAVAAAFTQLARQNK
jgi:hypothetical protein